MLTENAAEYSEECLDSIQRNDHMNNIDIEYMKNFIGVDLKILIDAILVDFVNCIGAFQGLDWALYTRDLKTMKEDVSAKRL